jgi:hypothetical protein
MSERPPSAVRIFAKSVHWLAGGWALSVGWIWLAGMRQALVRQGSFPSDWGIATIVAGSLAALLIEGVAVWLIRLAGIAPHAALERREWHHAFWWSVVPNLLLIGTAYLMTIDLW